MAVDMFLKWTASRAKSKDHKHKDEIDVLAGPGACSQTGTARIGQRRRRRQGDVQDLSFTQVHRQGERRPDAGLRHRQAHRRRRR